MIGRIVGVGDRVVARVDRVVEAALALLMAAMCVLVFVGVAFRYVLLEPIIWAEEVAEFCLVWATFLGAYLAYRRGKHIKVTTFFDKLPRSARRAVRFAVYATLAVFMGMLIVQGGYYARVFLDSYSPIIEFPLGVVYAALPLGAALFLLAILLDLGRALAGSEPEPGGPTPGER